MSGTIAGGERASFMKRILVIGIGPGDPDQITVQAIRAIARADLFFLFDKGEDKAELVELRALLIERYAVERPYRVVEAPSPRWSSAGPNYAGAVDDLNARKVAMTGELVAREMADGECAAILVWGDPALYDSTIRIMDMLCAGSEGSITFEVIPGISSLQALAARHRTPWNAIGGAVEITTGRRLAEGEPSEGATLVMLDARNAFLAHRGRGLTIRYGAYVGMRDEILIEGPLDQVADEIVARRAQARARKGWIMDSYMLAPTSRQ